MSAIFDFGYQYNRRNALAVAAEELEGIRAQSDCSACLVDIDKIKAASEMKLFLSPNEIIAILMDADLEMDHLIRSFWERRPIGKNVG